MHRRSARLFAAFLLIACAGSARGGAQNVALSRGLDHEQAGRMADAAAAYREAMHTGALTPAVLGLERTYAELGWTDSLLPILDSLIVTRPDQEYLRTVQLRSLQRAGRDAEMRQAWERWVARVPRDPRPYQEFSRLLLDLGQTAAADSVLRRADAALGSGRALALQQAQLYAATGQWTRSATSWRHALADAPYLDQAASFALYPAPAETRDSLRAILLAPVATRGARNAVAGLALAWGDAGTAWIALEGLPPDDSSAAAWLRFAERAEQMQAWPAAHDAYAAALVHSFTVELAARAMNAALEAGDPRSALSLAERARSSGDSRLVALRVRALTTLGRMREAQQVATRRTAMEGDSRPIYRELAWGWARAGQPQRAREALASSGAAADDEIYGWLALYSGDLATARRLLRHASERSTESLTARALLVRTRADSAPIVGEAFLALARGDSAVAAERMIAAAARGVPDAAPLLLGSAARLRVAAGDTDGAIALWQAIMERHELSPEAPEAALAWARHVRDTGDSAAAASRLEELILNYPRSALVPQARRELDIVRAAERAATPH